MITNKQNVRLNNVLEEALKDKDFLFSELIDVTKDVYFNERTLKVINQSQVNSEIDSIYLIKLNTIGLKSLLNFYDNNKKIDSYHYDNKTFSFTNKEEVLKILQKLFQITTKTSLLDKNLKYNFNHLNKNIFEVVSVRFIFDLFNISINFEKNGTEDEIIDIFWYKLLSILPSGMSIYNQYLMAYFIKNYRFFNINALKVQNFCRLLLNYRSLTENSPFEINSKDLLFQEMANMIVKYKNRKLLINLIKNRSDLDKIKNMAEITKFKSFDARAWYYNAILDLEKENNF